MQVTFGNIIQRNNVLPVHPRKKEDKKSDLIVDMNRATLYDVKYRGLFDYPDATSEDYARLTSITVEDSYKRATYVQPTSGKVFHLLEEERSEDKVKLKVLDERGKFQKFIEVEPKHVIIVDNFSKGRKNSLFEFDEDLLISHGDVIKTYLLRTNPWVNYECKNIGMYYSDQINMKLALNVFDEILEGIKKGKKVDLINCSYGTKMGKCNLLGEKIVEIKSDMTLSEQMLLRKLLKTNIPETYKNIRLLERIQKSGVQIYSGAGNDGKDNFQALLLARGVEGVGSLDKNGKISDFSSTRNKKYTPHYECGEHLVRVTEEGINITGLEGTDIKCPEFKKIQKLTDKDITTEKEFQKMLEDFKDKNAQGEFGVEFEEMAGKYGGKLIKLSDYLILTNAREEKIANESSDPKYEQKYIYFKTNGERISVIRKKEDEFAPFAWPYVVYGTSFSTPVRAGKVLLHEMLEGKI